MKPWVLTTFVLLSSLSDATAQQPVDVRRGAVSDGTVKISAGAGKIRIVGWFRDTVAVTGVVGRVDDVVEIRALDQATTIHVGRRVNAPDQGDRSAGTDLEIRVPLRSYVAVRTVSAEVDVDSLTGGVDLETETGSIRVLGFATRSVYAESAAGDIEVAAHSKIVRVKSVNGRITVRRALGFLTASTVSGDIRVGGDHLSQVEVSSVSGNIEFDGSLARDGFGFTFESHGGSIELRLPENLTADLDVRALKGRVENAFAPASGGAAVSVGGGGAPIKVTSFKGHVRISKRP